MLEEQRRREEEEEERLKQELQRLQELQQLRAVKKKKKERTNKDCQKVDVLTQNCQTAKESVPNAPEDIQNGTLEQSEKIETSSGSLSRHVNHTEQRPLSDTGCEPSNAVNTRDSKLLYQKEGSVKQHEPLSFLLDIMHQHKEGNNKQKLKQINKQCAEQVKKPVESSKASEIQTKTRNQIESKAKAELPVLAEPKKEEKKLTNNNNNKKQLNHIKEEKAPITSESPSPSEQQQNNKLILADSPQPKGKNKKNKKKKGDKVNNSIGKKNEVACSFSFLLFLLKSRSLKSFFSQSGNVKQMQQQKPREIGVRKSSSYYEFNLFFRVLIGDAQSEDSIFLLEYAYILLVK